jgi:hypothetical protein
MIQRPTSAAILSIVWIILGVPWIFIGVFGVASSMAMQRALEEASRGPGGPYASSHTTPFLLFFLFAFAVLTLGVAGVVFGAAFWKLRAWARSGLEWTSWGTVVLIVLFSTGWAYMWSQATSSPEGIFIAAINAVLVGAPFVYMALKLRGRTIRDAVGRQLAISRFEQSPDDQNGL